MVSLSITNFQSENSSMTDQAKSVIGWAFIMIAFSIIPYATTIIVQPTMIHMVVLMTGIGAVAAFVGNLFK